MSGNIKEKIIIIGGGGHAKAIICIIKKLEKYDIIGYTDIINKGLVLGVKYLGTDEVLSDIIKNIPDCNAVIGIGNITLSDQQRKIYKKLKDLGFKLPVIISKNALVKEEVVIGEGTVVFEGAIINVCSILGICVVVNTRAIVEYDCYIGDFVHLTPLTKVGNGVKIGNNSFIGSGTMIKREIEILDNCLTGAGSVILESTIQQGKYLGIPAILKELK